MRSKNTTSREDDKTTVDRSIHGPSPTHMRPVQVNQSSNNGSQNNSNMKMDIGYGGTLTLQCSLAADELMQRYHAGGGMPTSEDFYSI